MSLRFTPPDKIMYYILYDLRDDPSLANIHLPRAADSGPILLRVTPEQYRDVAYELRDMCINEGDEWVTTLIVRPEYAPDNTGDLEPNAIYILIANIQLLYDNPNEFLYKLRSMKKLVFH